MKVNAWVAVACLFSAAIANGEDQLWEVSGKVRDENGKPVAEADVTTYWSANGVSIDERKEVMKRKDLENDGWKLLYPHEGKMVPWGIHPAKTDADGRFSIKVHKNELKLMVIDKNRKRGAVIELNPKHPNAFLHTKLEPLIRLHGTIRKPPSFKEPLEWTAAMLSLPTNQNFPLGRHRLSFCGSLNSRFEFLLPPGKYVLHAYNDSPNAETVPDRKITLVADKPDVDLGVLELTRRPNWEELTKQAKARETWGDYKKHYGRKPPKWHVADARGIGKTRQKVQPSDLTGKWVLLYFWSPWCAPCLGKGLPNLVNFYETHKKHRDKFEIVAFCLNKDGDFNTLKDLDKELEAVIKSVWGGKPLPFPVLLDNTFQTSESYGLDRVGVLLLIDPEGNLVKGDENTLAEKLDSSTRKTNP